MSFTVQIINNGMAVQIVGNGLSFTAPLNASYPDTNDIPLDQYFTDAQLDSVRTDVSAGGSGLTGDVGDYTLHVCTTDQDVRARQRAAIRSQLREDPNDPTQASRREMARIMLQSLPSLEQAGLTTELLNAPDELRDRIAALTLLRSAMAFFGLDTTWVDAEIQSLQAQLQDALDQQAGIIQIIRQGQQDGTLDDATQNAAQEYVDSHPGSESASQVQGALNGTPSPGSSGEGQQGEANGSGSGGGEGAEAVAYMGTASGDTIPVDENLLANGAVTGNGTMGVQTVSDDSGIDPIAYVVAENNAGTVPLSAYDSDGPVADGAIAIASADNIDTADVLPESLSGASLVYPEILNTVGVASMRTAGARLVAGPVGSILFGGFLTRTERDGGSTGGARNYYHMPYYLGLLNQERNTPLAGVGPSPLAGTDGPGERGPWGRLFRGFGGSSGSGSSGGLFDGSFGALFASDPASIAEFAQYSPAILGIALSGGMRSGLIPGGNLLMNVANLGRAAQSPHYISHTGSRGDSRDNLGNGSGRNGSDDRESDEQRRDDDQPNAEDGHTAVSLVA